MYATASRCCVPLHRSRAGMELSQLSVALACTSSRRPQVGQEDLAHHVHREVAGRQGQRGMGGVKDGDGSDEGLKQELRFVIQGVACLRRAPQEGVVGAGGWAGGGEVEEAVGVRSKYSNVPF